MAPRRLTYAQLSTFAVVSKELEEWRSTVPVEDWNPYEIPPELLFNIVTVTDSRQVSELLDITDLSEEVQNNAALYFLKDPVALVRYAEYAMGLFPMSVASVYAMTNKFIFLETPLSGLEQIGDKDMTTMVNSIRLLLSHLVEYTTEHRSNWTLECQVWAHEVASLVKLKAVLLIKTAMDRRKQGLSEAHARCMQLMLRAKLAVNADNARIEAYNDLERFVEAINLFVRHNYPKELFNPLREAVHKFGDDGRMSRGIPGSVRLLVRLSSGSNTERGCRNRALVDHMQEIRKPSVGPDFVSRAQAIASFGFHLILGEYNQAVGPQQ